MKNRCGTVDDHPLDREIDFSNAHPNRFWLGVVDRACVRLIDKDLVDVFPDNDSVNEALRTIIVGRLIPAGTGRPGNVPRQVRLETARLQSLRFVYGPLGASK